MNVIAYSIICALILSAYLNVLTLAQVLKYVLVPSSRPGDDGYKNRANVPDEYSLGEFVYSVTMLVLMASFVYGYAYIFNMYNIGVNSFNLPEYVAIMLKAFTVIVSLFLGDMTFSLVAVRLGYFEKTLWARFNHNA